MTLKKLLYWLLAGSRGGPNRARILNLLSAHPANAKQMADSLSLNYKTVQHHLDLLKKHNLLDSLGDGYGKAYTLSAEMEGMMDEARKLFKNQKP